LGIISFFLSEILVLGCDLFSAIFFIQDILFQIPSKILCCIMDKINAKKVFNHFQKVTDLKLETKSYSIKLYKNLMMITNKSNLIIFLSQI